MSLDIYSPDGYIGPAASNAGWDDLLTVMDGMDGPLETFFDSGFTDDPASVAECLRKWIESDDAQDVDPSIIDTAQSLAGLLDDCTDAAVVTDGVDFEGSEGSE